MSEKISNSSQWHLNLCATDLHINKICKYQQIHLSTVPVCSMTENDRSSIFMIDHRSPQAIIADWSIFQQDHHNTMAYGLFPGCFEQNSCMQHGARDKFIWHHTILTTVWGLVLHIDTTDITEINIWPLIPGHDINHLVYMPIGHMVLKIHVPCKYFHVPSQYLYKPCKAYVYYRENKYVPRLKHVTTKVYVPWNKIYMPRACGHALMSSPALILISILWYPSHRYISMLWFSSFVQSILQKNTATTLWLTRIIILILNITLSTLKPMEIFTCSPQFSNILGVRPFARYES